jgi:toxin HigB-1
LQTLHALKAYRHKGVKPSGETGSKVGIQPERPNRLRTSLSALDAATCPANMNAPGYAVHWLKVELDGRSAVRTSGNCRLTFAFEGDCRRFVDYKDCNYKDWHSGLRMLFRPSHPGEVLQDYLDGGEGGGQSSGSGAPESFPDIQRPHRNFIGDERKACQRRYRTRNDRSEPLIAGFDVSCEFWLKRQLNDDFNNRKAEGRPRKSRLPKIKPFLVRLQRECLSLI